MIDNNQHLRTYYDVLQLLKKFDVYIYVGRRLYDIELAALELDHLAQAGVIDQQTYLQAKVVLRAEHHRQEVADRKKHKRGNSNYGQKVNRG